MTSLNTLENFRTKEEFINYFKENGQTITEEEIKALKQSYEQIETNSNTLAMQQLDEVAGGGLGWFGGLFHNVGKAITGFLAIQSSVRSWNQPQVHHVLPKVFGESGGPELCVNREDVRECYQVVNLSKNEIYSFLQFGEHNLCAVQESSLKYYDEPSLQSLMDSYLSQSNNPRLFYLTCFKEKDFFEGAGAKIFHSDDLLGYVVGVGENGELLKPAGRFQVPDDKSKLLKRF